MSDTVIFPVLETERLRLRAFEDADARNIFLTYSEDIVTKYYDINTMTKMEEAEEIVALFQGRFARKQGIRWAIELKSTGEYIGDCGYNFWNRENRKVDVGYALIPKYWSNGYALEAMRKVIDYGFTALKELELNRIAAYVEVGNTKSKRLLEKLNFIYEGQLRQNTFKNGAFVSMDVFSILAGEYEGLKGDKYLI